MVLLQIKDNAKYENIDFPGEVIVVKEKPVNINLNKEQLREVLAKNSELMVLIPTDKKGKKDNKEKAEKKAKEETEKKAKEEAELKVKELKAKEETEKIDVSKLDDKSKARVNDLKDDLEDDGKRNRSHRR